MKQFIEWLKWSVYRIQVAKEMYIRFSGTWSFYECWSYAICFQCSYESMVQAGDKPIAVDDVEEEISCWND